MGYGATIVVVLLIITMRLTLFQISWKKKFLFYIYKCLLNMYSM